MASRPVVSYDDITLPYEPSPDQSQPQPPPQKKRKRNHHHHNHHQQHQQKKVQQQQHWDDPNPIVTGTEEDEQEQEQEEEESESRELTQEEIWDDSALIDAWNAAMEEYEAYHGPDKGWKREPVHKSPLWYNIPPTKKKNKLGKSALAVGPRLPSNELDSQPLDFKTFVPTHDPGLSGAVKKEEEEEEEEEEGNEQYTTTLNNISQDEAFERAVQASYWSGYWTAVYHYHRQNQTNTAEEEEEEEEEEDEMQDFTTTQR